MLGALGRLRIAPLLAGVAVSPMDVRSPTPTSRPVV
jgi:hypothetical protein